MLNKLELSLRQAKPHAWQTDWEAIRNRSVIAVLKAH